MTVQVKFIQSGTFHAGEIKSLDLEKISRFQITHQRNTCELFVTTPENPRRKHRTCSHGETASMSCRRSSTISGS